MSGNYVSESGKKVTEKMSATVVIEDQLSALERAKSWADELMDAEFQGRGDKEKSVRYRLSRKTGVPESYLFRLQYKTRDMKDVAGSVYQALMLAKASYDRACAANEEAADRYKAERLNLQARNETTNQKPAPAGKGMAVPSVGKAERKKA